MSIAGRIEDFSIVDIVHYIHLSGKDGILHFQRQNGSPVHLYFREGQIVRAEGEGMPNVGDILLQRGLITRPQLDTAIAKQASSDKAQRLGQIFQAMGVIDAATLREVILSQLEIIIRSLIAWGEGSFTFEICEGDGGDDIAVSMGELVLPNEVNTEYILLEAMRKHDEGGSPKRIAAAKVPDAAAGWPLVVYDGGGVNTEQFLHQLGAIQFSLYPLGSAEKIPRQVLDLHQQGADPMVIFSPAPETSFLELKELLQTLFRIIPQLPLILLTPKPYPGEEIYALYGMGVHAILPLPPAGTAAAELQPFRDALHANLLRLVKNKERLCALGRDPKDYSCNFLRVKTMLIEAGRSGKEDVSIQFLRLLSYYLSRALLFLPEKDSLRGICGYGKTLQNTSLNSEAKHVRLPLDGKVLPAQLLKNRGAFGGAVPEEPWAKLLFDKIGAPRQRRGVLLPMCGLETVMCMVYADHGSEDRPLPPLALLEIAADQTGMILEHSFMRKQLARKA